MGVWAAQARNTAGGKNAADGFLGPDILTAEMQLVDILQNGFLFCFKILMFLFRFRR